MKLLIKTAAFALLLGGVTYSRAQDTPNSEEAKPAKLNPFQKLQLAYAQRQQAQQVENSTASKDDSKEKKKKPTNKYLEAAKYFGRELAINYIVLFGSSKIMYGIGLSGREATQKELLLGTVASSFAIRIPPLLNMIIRSVI